MEKEINNYILTEANRSVLLKYLYTKPYQEVAAAIAVLARLEKIDPKINPNFVKDVGKKNDTKS